MQNEKVIGLACAVTFILYSSAATGSESSLNSALEPKPIAVEEIVSDAKIQRRLIDILTAVGSYENVQVKVVSGVAILSGLVDDSRQIEWVGSLATRMDGVVAVQSKIKSRPKGIMNLAPAREEVNNFNNAFVSHLPTILISVLVLTITFLLFFLASYGLRRAFSKKIPSPLLLKATSKILAIPIFLLGLYLALRISGLAGLAFTVLGGTGLLGLVLGLGLKNSFEDYAASILLSIKKPFHPNDWVKIGQFEGIVQKVTSRSTLIIDFAGNHILMPNSLVYKSIITNMTANPKMRCDFVIGLDYADSIEKAQTLILSHLSLNQFIFKEPEPWVLVDELAGSSINLRVYFWLNAREVSIFKVTSHILLDVKNLLHGNGFRFPDPNREIVFTNSLSLGRNLLAPTNRTIASDKASAPLPEDVRAEATELIRQSHQSDFPDQGESVI